MTDSPNYEAAVLEIERLRDWISKAKASFSLTTCPRCGSPVFPGHICGYCRYDDSEPCEDCDGTAGRRGRYYDSNADADVLCDNDVFHGEA